MIIDSPIISGSQSASGPLTQIGDVYITGSLNVLGAINGSITGSITSASYATNAEFLDRLDSTSFVFTSSFNTFSGSAAGRITNLEAFSSSLDATFATDASVTASILVLSQSVQASEAALSSSYTITSASFAQTSGSLSIRTGNLEATSSTLVSASGSFAADSASLSTRLTGDEANITTLTNASSSFAAQSASLSTRLTTDESNFNTTSGSLSTRVTNLESTSSTVSSSFATTSGSISSRVTIIEGQDATTGSNTFTGPQFINQASNAISFTSTASLYTDGGLRVSKDSFVSGTAYFNNVVVYGTSSIQYITSSQVNFGTNIITVNTDTPAVRFGGLAVYDSGSTSLTGSMLWDSEKNYWVYSNPSGSTYSGGMIISGPRNTGSLGNEVGTTGCALMMGQGGDHITSSAIFSYGNATCFYGQSFISSSGAACFSSTVCAPTVISTGQICSLMVNTGCIGIGTATPSSALQIYKTAYTGNQFKTYAELQAAPTTLCYTTSDGFGLILNMYEAISGAPYTRYADIVANTGDISNSAMRFFTKAASVNATEKMRITPEGDVGIGTAGGTYGKFTVDASNQSYTIAAIGNDQTSARIRIKNTGASGGDYAWIAGVNNIGNAGFSLLDITNSATRFDIASTGAATFACTITSNGGVITSAGTNAFVDINGSTSGTLAGIRLYSDGSTKWIISHSTPSTYRFSIGTAASLTTFNEKLGIDYSTGAATFSSKVLVNSATDDAASALQIKVLSANSTSARIASTTNNNLFSFISNDTPGHAILDMGKYTESGTYASGYIRLRTDGNSWIQGGNVGIGCTTPKTRAFVLGLAGGQVGAGGCGCSAYSGGGKPAIYSYYGDQFGNGAPYGASAGTIAPYDVWYGGGAGGYFKGGDGDPSPGGGAAGIVAIGGNGSTYAAGGAPYAEGGAGIYARGGFNQDGTTRTWAGYFDGCVYACGITTSDFVNVSAASSAYYGLKVAGVSGAARAIFLAGQVGYSNGFTVDYTGTAMKYSFINGNVGIGTTDACSILDVRGTITNGATAGSNSTIDVSPAKQSIASGGYVDFPSMSGMIVVNDWTDGTITIFLAGGGSTSAAASAAGQAGALYYNSGVTGYRWCNTKGYTACFGFLVFKTRNNA